MQIINNVTVGDTYTAATTIENVFNSNGGYFLIGNNDCFMQMAYNIQGQEHWTKEIHVPTGSGQIFPGTAGIRFRNFTAGSPALLSAAISENKEPSIAIGSSGVANVGGSTVNITPVALASWPPSSPVDGQLAILQLPVAYDPIGGKLIRWLFSYNNSDGVWDFLGGPSIIVASASTTLFPRNGDYIVEGKAVGGNGGTTTGANQTATLTVNAVVIDTQLSPGVPANSGSLFSYGGVQSVQSFGGLLGEATAVIAAQTLAINGAGTNPKLKITPIRIT